MPHGRAKPIVTRFAGAQSAAAPEETVSAGGASIVAGRLGIGLLALDTYMRSNGGVPDGLVHALPKTSARDEAIAPPPDLVQRALPSPCARTPWVKRDRPRYFMPG